MDYSDLTDAIDADEGFGTSTAGGDQGSITEIERGLGFTDGFQFGCGFWGAALIIMLLAALALLLLSFLFASSGIKLLR